MKLLWKEKGAVRSLLESGNIISIRFAYPGHFYSPIPDLNEIEYKSKYIFDNTTKDIPTLNVNEKSMIQLHKKFVTYYHEMPFPERETKSFRYHFDNPYFSYGDGVILYCLMRHLDPNRIIEVGSGYSSAAMMDTNDLFLDKRAKLTFIEPYPHRLFGLISEYDKGKLNVLSEPVQEIDVNMFGCLQANDILFIDSSHVAKFGSDVLHIVFHILPHLKKGVIVHFHDIIWPFEYPKSWLLSGRSWNEAYFLRAFLQYNSAFEIIYFNSFMALHHTGILKDSMPKMLERPSQTIMPGNSSLWIRKVL